MNFQTKEQLVDLLIDLVAQKSVSNTVDEIEMAHLVIKKLEMIPYFQANPSNIFTVELNDHLKRIAVCALLQKKPENKDTLLMVSHIDTVGIDDSNHVGASILDPIAYTKALADVELSKEARADLDSGEWMFGRGVMDMKPGIVYQLSMLEYFAAQDDFDGNILVSFVPDEETNSLGVLKAIPKINEIVAKHQLNPIAALNNEPDFAAYPGDEGKYVYVGTVGKLLSGFYCYGATTHVGESLSGINANLLASKIINNMELNALFSETVASEVTMPPTVLKYEDHKDLYNVQTPISSHIYFNVQTFEMTPKDVMDKMVLVANKSADEAYDLLVQAQELYRKQSGLPIREVDLKPRVYTYQEIYDKIIKDMSVEDKASLDFKFKAITQDPTLDDRAHCVKMIEALLYFEKDSSPKIITFFAPPYYPHVRMQEEVLAHQHVFKCANEVIALGNKTFQEEIKIQHYFQGLCDLSYFALQDATKVMSSLQPNMPSFGYQYDVPLDEIAQLSVPIINYGAHGKDPHKFTERVLVDYSFETVPTILKELVVKLFNK